MAEKSKEIPAPTNSTTERNQPNPSGTPPIPKPRITIVGIGASAGGLPALQTFFDALPGDTGMAFVVVVHLHPEYESHLAGLLQLRTPMKVEQVTGQVGIYPNHVYVIPPNRNILVSDAHLDTTEFEESRGHRLPVDHFFRSLAKAHHDAVAIILSGGGSDGSVGSKDIKEEGGLLMVQDPAEAEYDSMPQAAISTGLADMVLPVRELAQKLVDYSRHVPKLPQNEAELSEQELQSIQRILGQVHARTGNDFTQYKRSTVLRRIQRRMQINGITTLEGYLAFMRGNPGEATAMFNDILIGVTNFFRDRESWSAVEHKVIPKLFEGREPGTAIRTWSIGCSTGEEAYSLAILLIEQADKLDAHYEIQVFASDLDESALTHAREGVYPGAIEADVSPERLERFFTNHGNLYQIKRNVRDMVLFTNHSVLRDPPFSRIDLIVCRNVLIYLQRTVQDTIFDIFHYALHPSGYLFLGASESAEGLNNLFRAVDKSHRIYQTVSWQEKQPHVPSLPLAVKRVTQPRQDGFLRPVYRRSLTEGGSTPEKRHQQALENFAPPSILVDDDYAILHISETAGRYLMQPRGPITTDLLKLIRAELQMEVRSLLFQAFENDKAAVSKPIAVKFDGQSNLVVITVRPQRSAKNDSDEFMGKQALVLFIEDESDVLPLTREQTQEQVTERDRAYKDALVIQLEAEAHRLREQLQAIVEEYDSSNEEMKAANEELQSINEEYRSATEELETSKEELQSLNEELQTVNNEMKNKLDEISRAHSDLENLMGATEIATLFLDRELRIQRFTPETQKIFNIMVSDRGRPIAHLTHKLAYDQLVKDAKNVLRTLTPVKYEVSGENNTWYLIRQRPYRTLDDRIDGVVITFIDITELKQAQQSLLEVNETLEERVIERTHELEDANQKLHHANDLFLTLFHANPVPTAIIRVKDDTFIDVNTAFLMYFDVERETVVGHTVQESGAKIQNGWKDQSSEIEVTLASGETRTIMSWKQPISVENNEAVISTFVDITERKLAEEYLRTLLNAAPDPTVVVNEKGEIVFVNDQLEDSFGYSKNQLIGKAVEELIPSRFANIHPENRKQYFTDLQVRTMGQGKNIFGLRSDGSEFPVEVSLSPLETESGILVIASIRDISERAETELKIRALASSLMIAEQDERQRIAQILHDDLQQRLFAIKMQLTYLGEAFDKRDEETFKTNFEQLRSWLTDAIATTRSLSKDISPLILKREGLAEALKWLVSQMKELYNLEVTLQPNGVEANFDTSLEVELFQAIRELLFNIVKHAETTQATILLEKLDKLVRITVKDEGKGFDAEALTIDWKDAHGLLNIHQRLKLLGCHLKILSEPGDGTLITIDVPS